MIARPDAVSSGPWEPETDFEAGTHKMPNRFNDDDGFEIFVFQRATCRHLDAKEGTRRAAHPDTISSEILPNEISHKAPHDGDHGLQCEAK